MIESENIVPNFDENGNLPFKCYEVTLDEIKEKFVDAFPNSKTRKSRFECFLDFIEDLQKNVKSCTRLLINGSFVRNVVNPYDIDFIIVIDSNKLTIEEHIYLTNIRLVKNRYREEYDKYKELYENQMIDEEELYNLDFFKFGCDFFRLDKLYDSHPAYDNYLENKKYWIEWWSHDRYNNPKGFLDLKMTDEVI